MLQQSTAKDGDDNSNKDQQQMMSHHSKWPENGKTLQALYQFVVMT